MSKPDFWTVRPMSVVERHMFLRACEMRSLDTIVLIARLRPIVTVIG